MPFSKNNRYRAYFVDRFGIPEDIMERFEFYEFSKGVWATTSSTIPDKNVQTVGIRALRLSKVPKPTTSFLRLVGKYATKNVVFISDDMAVDFLKGRSIENACGDMRGYVVVRTERDVLGCGLCRDGTLQSMVPKKYRPEDTWV